MTRVMSEVIELNHLVSSSFSASSSVPIALNWRIGHSWNASFHFSYD
jgi:hypothetical protein